MSAELRKTGISAVGEASWGTHFCYFYENKRDLLDILVPYFKAGLDNNEFCLLLISAPLSEDDAENALRQVVPDFDRHVTAGNIEILPHHRWYLKEGAPDLRGVINGWMAKLDQALANGYAGMRVSGNMSWIQERDWEFHAYERELDGFIAGRSAILLCTYQLALRGAAEPFDIAQAHQFALAKRQGPLEVVETSAPRQGKAEIERQKEELERRVVERTKELEAANDELRLGEASFRGAFDHAPMGMTLNSPSGRWLKANRAFCKMVGYSEEELLGRKAQSITHPDDLEANLEGIRQLLDRKIDSFAMEKRYFHKNGSIVWANLNATVVRNVDGKPLYMVSQIHDVTGRKQTEEQIHFQASLIDQVLNAVIVIDLKNRILFWNKYAEALYDWKAEEVLGRSVLDLIVPDESRSAAEDIILIAQDTGHWEGEFVVRRKDGSTFRAYFHGAAIRATSGEMIGLVGVHTDITERKRLDRELKESEDRFRSFMDHLPGFAWIKDANGAYVYMNNQLQEVLPQHQDDWMGRTDTDFWRPEIAAEYHRNDQQVLRYTRQLQALERWELEGQIRNMLVSKFRIVDARGGLLVAGTSIDVTERKHAEQALRDSQVHLQAILDNCPAMIFLKDVEGRYLQVNRQLERILNLTSEQIVGRTDAEVFGPELAAAFGGSDHRVLEGGCSLEFEELAVYADGQHTNIVHKFPLKDPSGCIYAIGGIATDITARKLEENELRKQKEVLQKIFDHIPVLISFIGKDGRFQLVNREWERTLGWSLEEIVNHDVDVLREQYPDPRDHQQVLDFIARANAKWAKFRTSVRDGRVIDTAWATIRLSDGTSIGIGRDITEQERAKEALRQSHNLQRAVVEGTPDAVFVKDRQGRYQMINSAGAGFVGKRAEEVIGRDDADIFAPETGMRIMQHDQEVMASGKAQTFEETVTAAGMTRTFLTTKDVYRDSKGTVIGLIGIARDITDRKRADEALRASEERYRDLVENAHDIIYSHDLEGNYTSVNKAVEQITGYSREEALKMNIAQVIAPDYLEQARSMIRRKLGGENETVYDLEIIAKDGRRIAIEVNTRLVHQDGVSVGVHGIARDVTERKRVQQELRESEERYRDLVENSTELICTHDLDGLILSANRASIKVLGYDEKDYLGKRNLRDILPLEFRDQFDDYLTRVRRDGIASGLMVAQTRTGERRIWEYHNTLRTEGVAKPIVRGMARDITERRRAEEQIKATSAQLRALSASLRSAREEEGTRIARELHDELGSALTGLKLDLEEVQRSLSGHGSQGTSSALQQKLASMTGLADATIDALKRISAELRPSILDDLGLLAAIEWQCEQFAARSGIPCQCHSLIENVDLTRDRATAVFRVLQEALTNILRHARASRVTITIQEEAEEFVFEVRDDGRGITDEEMANPRSLGLTGMRERVDLAGGRIEIISVDGGATGTVLTVRVPRADPSESTFGLSEDRPRQVESK